VVATNEVDAGGLIIITEAVLSLFGLPLELKIPLGF
jgi:hypothetical protein